MFHYGHNFILILVHNGTVALHIIRTKSLSEIDKARKDECMQFF